MSWFVKDGTASFEASPSTEVFIGATGPGEFPETGQTYKVFTFTPEAGTSGIVVFKSDHQLLDHYYVLYSYYWEGGVLKIASRIKSWVNKFGQSEEYSFFVKVGDVIYCVKRPERSKYACKQVDILNLLKYIEGKIDLEMLDKKALLLKLREEHKKRTDEQLRELETQNKALQAMVRILSGQLDQTKNELGIVYLNWAEAVRYLKKALAVIQYFRIYRPVRWFIDKRIPTGTISNMICVVMKAEKAEVL